MAITRTRSVKWVQVEIVQEGHPRVSVHYEHLFDDTEDDTLPARSKEIKDLRYDTADDPVNPSNEITDISGEDQIVQDICAAVWPSA